MGRFLSFLEQLFRFPAFDSPEMERRFWAQQDESKFELRRFFLIVAVAIYALHFIFDALVLHENLAAMLAIRFPTSLVLGGLLYWYCGDQTPDRRELIFVIFGMVGGISIIVLATIAPAPAADYYPFLLPTAMVFCASLLSPRALTVALVCPVLLALYWLSVPFSQTSGDALYALFVSTLLTGAALVIGAYTRERMGREQMIAQARLAETRREALASRDAALEASRAKSHLLANVSHELRTPMNAILGFSEVMKEEVLGPVDNAYYRQYVADIHGAGKLLQANIEDLLDVSRLEVGKMSWHDLWVPVTEIVERSVKTVARTAEAAQIDIAAHVVDPGISIYCDVDRTVQIAINLLTNAIKFSPRHSRIDLEAAPCGDGVVLRVSDRGCGIDEGHLETILQPFGQIDTNSFTASKGGLGLGLSIVQGLIERFDGRLEIDSEIGRGTTISVIVPGSRVRRAESSRHPEPALAASA